MSEHIKASNAVLRTGIIIVFITLVDTGLALVGVYYLLSIM